MSASDQPIPFVRKVVGHEGLSPESAPAPAPAPSHVTNEIIPPYKPHNGERSQCALPDLCVALMNAVVMTQRVALQVPARRHPGSERRPRVHVPFNSWSEVRCCLLAVPVIFEIFLFSSVAYLQLQWWWTQHSANFSGWSDRCAVQTWKNMNPLLSARWPRCRFFFVFGSGIKDHEIPMMTTI
jgi:hypothetical protein